MPGTIFAGDKKDRGPKAPAPPPEDVPPHPDPARRVPDKTGHINGHAPKPTLQ